MAAAAESLLKTIGKTCDFLKLSNDKKLLTLFDKNSTGKAMESVLFSDTVYKINRREKPQQRDLVVTSLNIYNFEPKSYSKCKRFFSITKLKGLVLQKGSNEMLLKVKDEYDYRYEIVRQAEVVKILTAQYTSLTGGLSLAVTFSDDLSKEMVMKEDVKTPSTPVGAPTINELIADKDMFRVAREGWLAKKGRHHEVWKRRFFRLCDKNILYYEAKQKANGKLDLESGQVRTFIDKRHNEFEAPYRTPHLFKMLLEKPETRAPLVKYADQMHDSDYLNLYLEIEDYRKIAMWLPNSAGQHDGAAKIYEQYIAPGADCEINLPPAQKQEFKDVCEVKKSSNAETFDTLQVAAMENIKMTLLPGFLAQEAKKRDAQFKLKKALTEEDKKVASCSTCLADFSMFRPRNHCRYCDAVFCNNCLSKKCKFPAHFKVGDEPLPVCDICYGCIGPDKQPFGFSYASKARNKPLNLAAATAGEQKAWVDAIRSTIELAGNKKTQSKDAESDLQFHLEGWLLKEDPTTKLWRRRYFVLNGGALYYYEMFLKGSLSLAEGAGLAANTKEPTVAQTEAVMGGLKSASNFAFRFTVSQTDRLYKLAADTEMSLQGWLDAMAESLKTPEAKAKELADSKSGASGGGAGGDGKSESQALTDQYSASFLQKAPEGNVTFVFTDVQNSTKLWEAAGPAMNAGLEKHDALMRMLLKQFNGYEVKTEGDAFMVTFFNVLDAVRWCIAVQMSLMQITWPADLVKQPSANKESSKDGKSLVWNGIRVRMGIHTGQPNCRRNPTHGRMDYFGPVVNRSARISDSAHGGQIICTQEVMDQLVAGQKSKEFKKEVVLEELGSFPYKGIADPVKVFQITPKELTSRNPFPKLRIEEKMPKKPEQKAGGSSGSDKKTTPAAAAAATGGNAPKKKSLPAVPPSKNGPKTPPVSASPLADTESSTSTSAGSGSGGAAASVSTSGGKDGSFVPSSYATPPASVSIASALEDPTEISAPPPGANGHRGSDALPSVPNTPPQVTAHGASDSDNDNAPPPAPAD